MPAVTASTGTAQNQNEFIEGVDILNAFFHKRDKRTENDSTQEVRHSNQHRISSIILDRSQWLR
jgi:hypothetical protein